MQSASFGLVASLAAMLILKHDCYAKGAATDGPLFEIQLSAQEVSQLKAASKKAIDTENSLELFSKYERGIAKHDGDIFDAVFIKSLSPIPSNCTPIKGTPPLYVLTKDEIALVRFRRDDSYHGYFDVRGLVLIDKNANGIPEAYGFGSERSSMGGDSGPQHSVRSEDSAEDLMRSFDKGLTVIPWHSPTLFIEMSDWTCRPIHFSNGDIGRK